MCYVLNVKTRHNRSRAHPFHLYSLIDRRGFLPADDAPQTVTSDAELPPFMAKNDTNMVRAALSHTRKTVLYACYCGKFINRTD